VAELEERIGQLQGENKGLQQKLARRQSTEADIEAVVEGRYMDEASELHAMKLALDARDEAAFKRQSSLEQQETNLNTLKKRVDEALDLLSQSSGEPVAQMIQHVRKDVQVEFSQREESDAKLATKLHVAQKRVEKDTTDFLTNMVHRLIELDKFNSQKVREYAASWAQHRPKGLGDSKHAPPEASKEPPAGPSLSRDQVIYNQGYLHGYFDRCLVAQHALAVKNELFDSEGTQIIVPKEQLEYLHKRDHPMHPKNVISRAAEMLIWTGLCELLGHPELDTRPYKFPLSQRGIVPATEVHAKDSFWAAYKEQSNRTRNKFYKAIGQPLHASVPPHEPGAQNGKGAGEQTARSSSHQESQGGHAANVIAPKPSQVPGTQTSKASQRRPAGAPPQASSPSGSGEGKGKGKDKDKAGSPAGGALS
jgi:hypothetical protein